MNIVFVNGAHPDEKIGGAELQSWLLAKALAHRHEVTFLAVRSDTDFDKTIARDGVNIVKMAKTKKFSLDELRRIYRRIEDLSPDVVHLRMFDYIYLFKFISMRRRIPVVYHISSIQNCMAFRPGSFRQIKRKSQHLVNYFLMRRLPGLICQTEDQRTAMQTFTRPMTTVRNSAPGEWRGEYIKDEKLVLWVANIKRLKRPLDFVEIAQRLEDKPYRFLMIGYPQDTELATEVIARTRDLENLDYIPGVPIQEIAQYFRKASVVASTSEVEGYPNTFIQAIQSATPVVSLKLDPDDILTESGVGYCAPDLSDMTMYLDKLLDDQTRLQAMRQRTKICFDKNFSIRHNAKELEEYLLSISTT